MHFRTAVVATVCGLSASAAAQGTRLLRQPTVSATKVAFTYPENIWIAGRDGGDGRRLTRFPGVESDPQLSPDPNGKPRIRLKVDSLGRASLEFLDEKGTVTSRLPQ